MNSKKQNFYTKFLVVLALSVVLASLVFAEPKSLRYNHFYPSNSPTSNSLSGYATAIPPNTSIGGNAIEVQPSTSSSPTFVVKESGYVGIGIPGPLAPLHVKTSAGQLRVSEGGSNSINLTVRNNANDGYGSLASDASDYWWSTSGNSRMTLDSQGRLGVGTNTPQSPLHVKTSAGQLKVDPSGVGSVNLTVRNNADTDYGWLGYSAAGHTWYAKTPQEEVMGLGSDGTFYVNTKVGIGTASPSVKFEIKGASTGDDLVVSGLGNSVARIGSWTTGSFFALKNVTGSDNILFRSYGNSYFNGGLGIGTTNPSKKLTLNVSDGDGLYIQSNALNADPGLFMGRMDTDKFRVAVRGSTGNSYLSIWDETKEVDSGLIVKGNNVGVGTTDPQAKLHVNGNLKLDGLSGSGKFLCIDESTNEVYRSSTVCQ